MRTPLKRASCQRHRSALPFLWLRCWSQILGLWWSREFRLRSLWCWCAWFVSHNQLLYHAAGSHFVNIAATTTSPHSCVRKPVQNERHHQFFRRRNAGDFAFPPLFLASRIASICLISSISFFGSFSFAACPASSSLLFVVFFRRSHSYRIAYCILCFRGLLVGLPVESEGFSTGRAGSTL